jgi:hypothetical protein
MNEKVASPGGLRQRRSTNFVTVSFLPATPTLKSGEDAGENKYF